MLLRSALGMAIIMLLMGMAQNVWQFLILRALGSARGFIPNANALIATQIPRQKSGWALGTLSTGGVSGALLARWRAGCWPTTTDCGRYSSLPPACCSSASGDAYLYPGEFHAGSQKRCCTPGMCWPR